MAGSAERQGKRRDRNEWRQLVERFEGSGLSVEGFCRREGISAASFYRWRNLLEAAPAVSGGQASGDFLELGLLTGTAAVGGGRLEVRLELGNGVVLQLVRG